MSGVDESSSDMIPRSGSGSGSRRNKTRRDETGGGVVYAMYEYIGSSFGRRMVRSFFFERVGDEWR